MDTDTTKYRFFHVCYAWAASHGNGRGDMAMRGENTVTSRSVINDWRRIVADTLDSRVSAEDVTIAGWQEYEGPDGWEKRT